MTKVKICGLTSEQAIDAAESAGVDYIGFNFFAKSPRFAHPARARELAEYTPTGITKVGLVVDVDDEFLEDLIKSVPLDVLQLHGSESAERVSEVKERFGLPVIKAIGIASKDDLQKIETYGEVADQLLVDAKAPKGSELPGGNGLPFDWELIKSISWPKPWMLAGGLNPENVGLAVQSTGALQVDTASGVESVPGVKDADLIKAFTEAARGA